jgi:hypothetical protein
VVAASEVAAVGGAGEAAVGDPDDPGQRPVAQVGFDLADQGLVAGVAGPAPHPDRDAGAGDRHADHDLRQVVAVVLGLAVAANPRLLAVTIAVAGLGQPVAALVPGDRRIRLIQLEVGGGGVEEQQVDLEVEEVGDLAEHLALQGGVDLQQPVHRPVAGVIGRLGQPRDGHVVADPAGGGQLRRRGQRPVGDQGEQHPLGPLVQPPALQQPPHRLVDPKAVPQPLQRPDPAQRPRLDELQALVGGGSQRPVGVQEPRDRGDQALQRGAVVGVLAAEVVEHLHPGPLGLGVPGVVGQLQVAHHRAVVVAPWGRPQVHGLDDSTTSEADQLVLGCACIYADSAFPPGRRAPTCGFSTSRSPEP